LLSKLTVFPFNRLGLRTDFLQAERSHHPDRLVTNEPAHVLPPDERNMLAELLPVEVDQPAPVARFPPWPFSVKTLADAE
jgi:hypothetical protein